jgi:Family of unknown function (DUF6263)
MRQRSWVGALLALGVLASPAFGQEQMAWKLKEGDKLFVETVSGFKQSMKTLGKEFRQDRETTVLYSVTVKSVDANKNAVLEEKVESVAVKNTGSPAGEPAAEDKFNQQLKDATFTVTVTPQGEVTKFEGYEELLKKIAGDDVNAKKIVQAVLTEEGLKRAATDAFGVLPAGPVKTGDKWGQDKKAEAPLGPLGSFTLTRTYTYDGKENYDGKSVDKISFTGTATYTPPKTGEASPLPFQVTKGDLKADDMKGTLYFDPAAGRVVASETSLRLKGNVSITVSGTPIDTEMQQDQTVKTRVLDKLPEAK